MGFSFYTVDSSYCEFLRKSDPCVPYVMNEKSNRPFVGIVFSIHSFRYYAPLASPKQKHLHMRNQVDFLKIQGGKLGAINFNNMIPVPDKCLSKVEIRVFDTDTEPVIQYKRLLVSQLDWCDNNSGRVFEQAERLYHMIASGSAWNGLRKRCCNFPLDEQQCLVFIENNAIV